MLQRGGRKSEQRAKNNLASFYLLLDEDQVILKFWYTHRNLSISILV